MVLVKSMRTPDFLNLVLVGTQQDQAKPISLKLEITNQQLVLD